MLISMLLTWLNWSFTFFLGGYLQEEQTKADLEGSFYVILLWSIWVSSRKLITLPPCLFN